MFDYVLHKISEFYELYLLSLEHSDHRVRQWPLMSSPMPTLVLVFLYLLIVIVGPKWMTHRKPVDLKVVLIVYNCIVMLLNLYIGLELFYCSVKRGYSWSCQLVDTSDNIFELRIASALWWYYISKLVEFFDTFFFISRKKNSQLSFLHIYHHSTMFVLWWIGVKWVPGGSAVPGALLNSFVHVLMYLYYGLSAFGPRIQKYLWWKRYLTIIQLTQFTAALIAGVYAIIMDCKFPLWMQYALVLYMCSFIILFGNFYWKEYVNKKENDKLEINKSKRKFINGTAVNAIRKRNGFIKHD
ncbi:Elongation of very long chain fatty acids protein 4 [Nymphon striatum]|nr:Elongation of very long chain fatty acids protein 4 [Nymphon striatum]